MAEAGDTLELGEPYLEFDHWDSKYFADREEEKEIT